MTATPATLKVTPKIPHGITRGFARTVQDWQRQHGRCGLPWQATRDPYRIWLSEIMLQQTQVSTVITYYQRFLARFPDLGSLARAAQDEVMPYWAGLGYYARARNLHRCAQTIAQDWGGAFPPHAQDLERLPGVGRSTAAAIAAFAYGERRPILDGNVRRVFCRYFGVATPPDRADTQRWLWNAAEDLLRAAPGNLDMRAYTQGLMDLGATICTRAAPRCHACPITRDCHAYQNGKQALLPAPKPKKNVPVRGCVMLILRHGERVVLQQRPAPGVWGGLWSLPQYEHHTALAADCRARGADAAGASPLARLQHTFTHFKLDIEPWLLDIAAGRVAPAIGAQERWQSIEHLAQAALPAPVRRLLEGMADIP